MKLIKVWHPDSPGMKVWVLRNWIQDLIYPKYFATLGEARRGFMIDLDLVKGKVDRTQEEFYA